MKYDNKSFQERYEAWKNGANYWKDIRGVNLGESTQEEPSQEEVQQLDSHVNQVLTEYNTGKDNAKKADTVGSFVSRIGPMLGRTLLRYGYGDNAYYNALRQLAYESNYGTSNIAIKNHNYGGVGWNGKTYTSYKSDQDFIDNYVKLLDTRYKSALNAKTTREYAQQLKNAGYYEDTVDNYSRNLEGMKTLYNRAVQHKKANPNQYTYQVKLSDMIDDGSGQQFSMNIPKPVVPEYVAPPAANFIDQGFIDQQRKREAQERMDRIHDLLTPTQMPNAIRNMITGNNKGKDAYGQKFWQRRGLNMHFKNGKGS